MTLSASIGVKGSERSAGSFGGYLTEEPGERRQFGLTCWHVVWPADSPTPVDQGFDTHGVKPGASSEPIEHPALGDHVDTMEKLRSDIRDNRARVNGGRDHIWQATLDNDERNERESRDLYIQ